MGFVLNLSNWHHMCLNHIYCYLFIIYDICLDNKFYIMYFYMYLLKSLYLLEFIVVYIFLGVDCIYSNCISTVFIGNVFDYFYF